MCEISNLRIFKDFFYFLSTCKVFYTISHILGTESEEETSLSSLNKIFFSLSFFVFFLRLLDTENFNLTPMTKEID